MSTYGLPYMGSKNKIAKWVLDKMPSAGNFYDLFCGGCSITHCAIEQNKYKNYYINDINPILPNGFIDCINGKYKNEDRWISSEDFHRLKGSGDLYVDTCFSFGQNYLKGYAYSKEIEPFKKAIHYAIFFNDFSLSDKLGMDLSELVNIKERKDKYRKAKEIVKKKRGRCELQSLERLNSLQSLTGLNRLQSLERLKDSFIHKSSISYDKVEIKTNSVIYCDIPYKGTAKYNDNIFDYDRFYNWALSQTSPIFISEYNMPSDFVCIAEKQKVCSLSATNNNKKTIEKIFIPKHQINTKQTLF